MQKFVSFLIRIVTRHTTLTIALGLALSALSLYHASQNLIFDTNQDNLISPDAAYFQNYKAFLKEFGDWEYVYVVIQTDGRPDEAKAYAKKLARHLSERPEFFSEVTEKIDVSGLKRGALLLLPDADFQTFTAKARGLSPELKSFLGISSSAEWYAWLKTFLEKKSGTLGADEMTRFWPLFTAAMAAPFDEKAIGQINTSRLLSLASGQYVDKDGYLFSENGKLLFIEILPAKDFTSMGIIAEPLKFLRGEMAALSPEFPGLKAGVTGKPVLQNDEADSTGVDSLWASLGSIVMVTLLFILFVKDWRLTFMALFALIAGIALTTGFVSLTLGGVNLLTIVFAVILIGMGLDYGVHFLLHYQILRQKGLVVRDGVIKALEENGVAILLGAGLTALGFSTAVFTDFWGLKQLGLIVGVGIILCCLAELTVFPALILKGHPERTAAQNSLSRFAVLIRLTASLLKYPRLMVALPILVTLFGMPLILELGFDYNLLKLQDPSQESVRYERLIAENAAFSTSFLSYMTKDLDDLAHKQNLVSRLDSVAKTESILDVVPARQETRLEQIAVLREDIEKALASFGPAGTLETELAHFKDALDELVSNAFSSGQADAAVELSAQSERVETFLTTQKNSSLFQAPHEKEFLAALADLQAFLHALLRPEPLTQSDAPEKLLSRFKSPGGYYALTIYPKEDVWDWDALERFLSQVRTVLPEVTGAPITTYESALLMNAGFKKIGIFTALIVFVLLVVTFRELKTPLFIFASLVLTFLLLFAFMGAANLDINLANFFALPILIGSNVDHGVYFFHHYREHKSLPALFQLTVPPVFLSCFTNIVGFASLALVRHQGLAGFGLIMSVGTLLSLLVTVIWLPAVIRVFYEKRR